MDRKETELLDALEDAREQVARDKRQLRLTGMVFTGSLLFSTGGFIMLSAMHSMGMDLGSASGTPYVIGLIVSIGSLVAGGLVIEDRPKNYRALKDAERAYRDYLNGDSYTRPKKMTNRHGGVFMQGEIEEALKSYGLKEPRCINKREDGSQVWIDDFDNVTYVFTPRDS